MTNKYYIEVIIWNPEKEEYYPCYINELNESGAKMLFDSMTTSADIPQITLLYDGEDEDVVVDRKDSYKGVE